MGFSQKGSQICLEMSIQTFAQRCILELEKSFCVFKGKLVVYISDFWPFT